MPPLTLTIGLDIGTSSTKAVAFDETGRMLARQDRDYRLRQPVPGAAILMVEEVVTAVEEALAALLRELPSPPLAIGLSGAMHSLVAVDEQGTALSPVFTWADTRPADFALQLRKSEEASAVFSATGTPLHAMSPLCKLGWLRNEQPELFARASRFVDLKSLLLHRWFGEYVLDTSLGSATGLMSLETLDWHTPALDLTGIDSKRLPPLVDPRTILNTWRPVVRERLGLAELIPLVVGASDGCLANLGAGLLRPGPAVITIGTSAALRMTIDRPAVDPHMRLFTYHLADNYYVTGGASNNGGKVMEWARATFFPGASFGEMIDAAMAVAPGSEGLLCVPYLTGERSPVWNAAATGLFHGLQLRHGPAHFARAALEGLLYNLRLIEDGFADALCPPTVLYANGGFTRSAPAMQLLATILNVPVQLGVTPEASALGAALLARAAVTGASLEEVLPADLVAGKPMAPEADLAECYAGLFGDFVEVYRREYGVV